MKCKVTQCDRTMTRTRYCKAHYHQIYVYGEIRAAYLAPKTRGPYIKRYTRLQCSIVIEGERCTQNSRSKGMCNRHYLQDYNGWKLTPHPKQETAEV